MSPEYIVVIVSRRPSIEQWQTALDRDGSGLDLGGTDGAAAKLHEVATPFETSTISLDEIRGLSNEKGIWVEAISFQSQSNDSRSIAAAGIAALGMMRAGPGRFADRQKGLIDINTYGNLILELNFRLRQFISVSRKRPIAITTTVFRG